MFDTQQRTAALDFVLFAAGFFLITKVPMLGTLCVILFIFRLLSGQIFTIWGDDTHPFTQFVASSLVLIFVGFFLLMLFIG